MSKSLLFAFRYRRADVLEQISSEQGVAINLLDVPASSDRHVHVWVRPDHCAGLAIRVQPEGENCCYVYLLETKALEKEHPESQKKVDAFHVLGKVEGGQMKLLRRRYIGEIPAGQWIQMQVRTEGDLLQGAILEEFAHYLSVRDASFDKGGVGVATLGSTGGFKNFQTLPASQSIRSAWWMSH